jgi:hypothetical protein
MLHEASTLQYYSNTAKEMNIRPLQLIDGGLYRDIHREVVPKFVIVSYCASQHLFYIFLTSVSYKTVTESATTTSIVKQLIQFGNPT